MSMESNMSGMMPPPPGDPPCASCTSRAPGRGNASGASRAPGRGNAPCASCTPGREYAPCASCTPGWEHASGSGNSEFPAGSVGGEERKVVLDDGR